jgi:hypothetical protein
MELTGQTTGAKPRMRSSDGTTTIPGFVNRNKQKVIEATGLASSTHPNQRIYHMKCEKCGLEYGANGADIHLRRCPNHDNGTKGEPLPKKSSPLFT